MMLRAAGLLFLASISWAAEGAPLDNGLEPTLRRHVQALAGTIGERSVHRPKGLQAAADYVRETWRGLGLKVVEYSFDTQGVPCRNLECDVAGSKPELAPVLVGAHYDAVIGCPGADDNASGVAAMLELTRHFASAKLPRALRFVAFANEEPPWFTGDFMGSRVYAAMARKRGDRIHAMLSIEAIACYRDEKGSQQYPPLLAPFYPDRGNFLAIVGSVTQRSLVKRFHGYMASSADLPMEFAAVPAVLPGVSWSDHASFWEHGYPALMVTDTAPYRNPHYHEPGDTPETLDYPRFTKATRALAGAIEKLAREAQ